MDCMHEHLEFEGWLGAPGVGQAWKCLQCGEAMWSPGGKFRAIPFADLDPSAYILTEEEVI